MREIDKELYRDAMTFFNKWQSKLSDLRSNDFEDCIDLGYTIRETLEYINQIRRSLEKVSDDAQIVIGVNLLARHKKSHATNYATAVSSNKAAATPPKLSSNPEAYFKVMDYIGVPRSVSERELVRIHFPAFEEYCTEHMENGKYPEGINPKDMHTKFKVSFRRKQGVLE